MCLYVNKMLYLITSVAESSFVLLTNAEIMRISLLRYRYFALLEAAMLDI